MDANRIACVKVMKEGISKGNYEITGVLKTGELIITLLSDLDKEYLKKILNSNKTEEEKLFMTKKLMSIKGRPAEELLQVYKQNTCEECDRSSKNGLRLR